MSALVAVGRRSMWGAALVALPGMIWLLPARAAAQDGDAIVIVNGQPIPRRKVVDLLMETRGLEIMQQVIAVELAKQETRRRGLQVTEADVEAQYRRALDEIVPGSDADNVPLTREAKERALQTILQQRCLTMPEFMLAMERNAHLRKAAEQEFRVTEATLREEFARRYGEKVEVRHIQLPASDTRALHEALDDLGRNVDFAEVARRLSVNRETAERGGLLTPFAFNAPDEEVPAALREVAFGLAPGQVSAPTLTDRMIHILKLERRIAPEGVQFEDVRGEVEGRLRERVLQQNMNALISELFQKAKINVLDRGLKREYEALLDQFSQEAGGMP